MGPPKRGPCRNSEQDAASGADAKQETALQEKIETELVNHLRKLQIFPDCEFVKDGGKEAKLVSLLYETHIYSDCESVKDGGKGKQKGVEAGQPEVLSSMPGSESSRQQHNPELGKPQLLRSKAGGLQGLLSNLDVYEVYMTIPNEEGVKGLYKAHVLVQRKDASDCGEGDDQFLEVKEIRIYCADEDPAENEAGFEIQLATGKDPENPTAFIRYIKAPRPKQRMQKYRSGRFCRKRKQSDKGVPRPAKRMCALDHDSDNSSPTHAGQSTNEGI